MIFAAKGWQTVSAAVPHATAQLASVVMELASAGLRPRLAEALGQRFAPVPVRRSSKTVAADGLTDFYLYVEERMEVDAFFALINSIDGELGRRGAGEVVGNAYGLRGLASCIDLLASDRKKAQKIAAGQARTFGVTRYRFEP